MGAKSRYVGIRVEPEAIKKLILLRFSAGDPGNMSAGLRYALDAVKVSGSIVVDTDGASDGTSHNDLLSDPAGTEAGAA